LCIEGFEVIDGALFQRSGNAQVGFLQQILSGAGIADHALQGAQQHHPLGEEDFIEA
jgi:hypothetical protein